jgi:ribosomal-protein-alanine N-acetyltransferase
MLVGKNAAVRTAREAGLDGLCDLIPDVRPIGDHWPLAIGSECGWITPFRDNGWWTDDFGRVLVTDRAGERHGYVNYYRASHNYPGHEIGCRIFRPEKRGKGILSEAVGLFVAHLLSAKEIERIQTLAHPDNVGSRRVLERCGFSFEGVLRRAHFDRGTHTDLATYAILRGESRPLEELLEPLAS